MRLPVRFPMPVRRAGFTLVELVVVIVLVGILAIVGANIIGTFVGGYTESAQRAELAGVGRVAIERMTREIRHSVPNSIRTDLGSRQLTLMRTSLGGRYVAVGTSASALQVGADPAQETFVAYGLSGLDATGHQLMVYPLDPPDLYADLATTSSGPRARMADAGGNQGYGARTISLQANDDFARHSPNRRILGADGVVAFCYLPAEQELRMAVHTPLAANPTTSCGSGDPLLAAPVTSASFTYQEGSLSRSGLVRIYLELTSPESGEAIDFQQEVHVRNVP